MFTFAYGLGKFILHDVKPEGEIMLSEHKLSLRRDGQEITSSFIPLDKVVRFKFVGNVLQVYVRMSVSFEYWARIEGNPKELRELAYDLAKYRGFRKQFLRDEWVEN